VVDPTIVKIVDPEAEEAGEEDKTDERPRFNEEHHLWITDAQKMKKDVQLEEELIFPLETKDDFWPNRRPNCQTSYYSMHQRS